ncbi:MAG: gliding motility-associated C-terminal domain-containing protein [Saprospiraceae bacterium]|jgi:gliding motility-associated-like protein|nr:gliding motility-associated C-terminal domain-containing protein [Saprospiraceae bacterium]
MKKQTILWAAALAFLPTLLFAQPAPCGSPAFMTSFCDQACVVCDIDGFTGRNSNTADGEVPPGFCTTTVHNAQWIAFQASSEDLTLSVSVSNCQNGNGGGGGGQNNGLEVGIYYSLDCENFELITNCDGEILPNTTQNFVTTVPLIIGQYYYFVMDGNGGDICDYTINVVEGSTEVPQLDASGPITGVFEACPSSSLTYTTPSLYGATLYDWRVNGVLLDTDTSFTYTWPAEGSYQLCVKARNVCDESTPTCQTVTIESIAPTVYVENLCGGEGFAVADTVLFLPGFYEFVYNTPADCDSVIQVTISAAPNETTILDLNICDSDTLWVGGNPYTTTGIYQENLTTWLGCDSTVNLDLFVIICEIQATVGASQVRCYGGSDGVITFSVDDGTPPFTYDWYRLGQPGPSGNGSITGINTPETLSGLPVGPYVINIQDAFGNDRVLLTDVGQPAPLDVDTEPSVYGGGFNVSCADGADGTLLASATGGLPPYSYAWSSGAATAFAQNLAAGPYTLTVTDNVGCTLTASYTLEAPNPLALFAEFNDPVCAGPLTGSITVQNAAGGIPPYLFSLNEGPYLDTASFTGLAEGPYTLSVQDANGCLLDSTVLLEAAIIPVLDLGQDTFLYLGDSIRLKPAFVSGAETYAWGQTPGLSCYDCPNPWVYIFHPMGYSLTVTSEDGCTASDSIFVDVVAIRDVYIPNAFSPNGDGINDLFNVFGGGVVKRVKSFKVFSRWGELVYEGFDFLPNNVGIGWDGSFRGKEMQGSVFAWAAEVEFLDDVVFLYKGDVVVVR